MPIEQRITPLPTPPSTADPANFDSRGDVFLGSLPNYGTELNTLAEQINSEIVSVNTYASTASTKAGEASASASAADTARAAAVTAKTAAETAKTGAETAAATATTKATDAATQAGVATSKAAEAAANAAAVSKGTDPWQLVRAGDLGTAAWLDQTWLYGTKTWDATSIAYYTQSSTTVSIPGATIGDFVLVSASIGLSGLHLRGEVTSTDTVTLYLSNLSGGSVDLVSAAFNVAVLKLTPAR